MHTEDHPLAYLDFHGVIPEGQYGAGVMDVYARGTYEVVKDHGKRGFTVRLQSERLRGDWTLVPAELDGKERNWLMFRSDDGAPGTAQHAPMLATMDDAPPRGSGWTHEIKWDGHRVLARLSSGEATLWSRTGKDATARFPKIAADLGRGLRSFECVVDGEVCALDAQGRPSFQLLQSGEGTLAYAVFDVLEEDGRDLTDLPLSERRERLEALVDETWPLIRLSRGFDDGARAARRRARARARGHRQQAARLALRRGPAHGRLAQDQGAAHGDVRDRRPRQGRGRPRAHGGARDRRARRRRPGLRRPRRHRASPTARSDGCWRR